jgi:hypothetical protein
MKGVIGVGYIWDFVFHWCSVAIQECCYSYVLLQFESWNSAKSFLYVANIAQRPRTVFLHILLHPHGMGTPSVHARAVTPSVCDVLLPVIVSHASED